MLHRLLNMFRAAAQPSSLPCDRIDVKAKLGGDDHLVMDWGKCFANQLFVGKGSIDFRGIKEGNSPLHRGVHQVDHFVAIRGRAVVHAHAHTAQPDGGYF